MQMVLLENKASAKWGLAEEDRSLYLDLQRIIETQGRSGSDGMSPRQAQIALGDMARRLGASKWRLMQQYGERFFTFTSGDPSTIRVSSGSRQVVRRLLPDADHYVATKRTWSMEEIARSRRAQEAARRGLAGGTTSLAICIVRRQRGLDPSSAKASGPPGSTFDGREAEAGARPGKRTRSCIRRRNQMVLDLKDALLARGGRVTICVGRTVRVPGGPKGRYGTSTTWRRGRSACSWCRGRLPRIQDLPNAQFLQVNGLVRSCLIDYNVAYTPQK